MRIVDLINLENFLMLMKDKLYFDNILVDFFDKAIPIKFMESKHIEHLEKNNIPFYLFSKNKGIKVYQKKKFWKIRTQNKTIKIRKKEWNLYDLRSWLQEIAMFNKIDMNKIIKNTYTKKVEEKFSKSIFLKNIKNDLGIENATFSVFKNVTNINITINKSSKKDIKMYFKKYKKVLERKNIKVNFNLFFIEAESI